MNSKLIVAVKNQLKIMGEGAEINANEWFWAKEAALDDAYGNCLCMMCPVDPERFAQVMAIGIRMWRQSNREVMPYVHTAN
jgi:hypothetical protein